jgi:hypothetical protein
MRLGARRYKKSAIVSFGDVGIDESKASGFFTLKKVNLHSHQKHVVLFFDQNRNSIQLKLLVFSFWLVKSQCISHPSAAAAFDTHSQIIIWRDIFGSHDVFDFGLGFFSNSDRNQHGGKINYLGFWFGFWLKFMVSAGFLTDLNCSFSNTK